MPQKMNMVISNNTPTFAMIQRQMNAASLATTPKAPSALNAGMLARVHNVRPGCGSCGRH